MSAIDGFFCNPIYVYSLNLGHHQTIHRLPGMGHFNYNKVWVKTHAGKEMMSNINTVNFSGAVDEPVNVNPDIGRFSNLQKIDKIMKNKQKTGFSLNRQDFLSGDKSDPAFRLRNAIF